MFTRTLNIFSLITENFKELVNVKAKFENKNDMENGKQAGK